MVSILIITYNRPADLLELLKSINGLGNDFARDTIKEVLILNNRSTVSYQDVQKFLVDEFEFKYQFFEAESNLGVAKGRN
ncbi:MAG TPA: glycosyltransferase, partial [Segetibacter sp.]